MASKGIRIDVIGHQGSMIGSDLKASNLHRRSLHLVLRYSDKFATRTAEQEPYPFNNLCLIHVAIHS